MSLSRRSFLKLVGLAASASASAAGVFVPETERVRRWWAVPRNAPVPTRPAIVHGDLVALGDDGYVYPADADALTWATDSWADASSDDIIADLERGIDDMAESAALHRERRILEALQFRDWTERDWQRYAEMQMRDDPIGQAAFTRRLAPGQVVNARLVDPFGGYLITSVQS